VNINNTIFTVLIAAIFASCDSPKMAKTEAVSTTNYPTEINAVFAKHGGINTWAKMKTLYFEIAKPDGNEKQTIDLQTRFDLIETPKATIGFDGTDSWVLEKGEPYKGKARFYHNLMFYFYAMPFVLGDKGIKYEKTTDLSFEGKTYSGYKIAYEAKVGDSPDDNYFLYLNKETNVMEWLGYTVTFGSNKPSDKVSFIRYNDWQTVNGLVLPNTLSWYKVENGVPTTVRNKVTFVNVKAADVPTPKTVFAKPEAAKYVSK
jgi:hypothetical protein